MVDPVPPRPPRLVAKALGTREIPAELVAILATYSQTVCEDRKSRTPEERSDQVIHSLLAQLASGMDLIPVLERVKMAGLYPDRRVLLMHSFFSVRVNAYLDQRRLFACLVNLPADPPPTR